MNYKLSQIRRRASVRNRTLFAFGLFSLADGLSEPHEGMVHVLPVLLREIVSKTVFGVLWVLGRNPSQFVHYSVNMGIGPDPDIHPFCYFNVKCCYFNPDAWEF